MDAGILEQVLYHIHNWFVRDVIAASELVIADGSLPASISSQMHDGMWYRIDGSYLNDGLHQYHETYPQGQTSDLVDETFRGTVSLLAIPKALLDLVDEIAEWVGLQDEARRAALSSPYQSESFGGYSYTLKGGSGADSGSGGLTGWEAEFSGRLNPFRKMY